MLSPSALIYAVLINALFSQVAYGANVYANKNLKAKRALEEETVTQSPTLPLSSISQPSTSSTQSFPVISPTLIVKKRAVNTIISRNYNNDGSGNNHPCHKDYEVLAYASTIYPESYKTAAAYPTVKAKARATGTVSSIPRIASDRILFNDNDQVKDATAKAKISSGAPYAAGKNLVANINVEANVPEYVLAN